MLLTFVRNQASARKTRIVEVQFESGAGGGTVKSTFAGVVLFDLAVSPQLQEFVFEQRTCLGCFQAHIMHLTDMMMREVALLSSASVEVVRPFWEVLAPNDRTSGAIGEASAGVTTCLCVMSWIRHGRIFAL